MPKITAISPQKRKGRFNIFIDGEFAFGIDEDTLVQEGLIVGKEISELEVGELEEKSEVGKLYQKALRFLEYRPRSERELYNYLKKKPAITEALKNAEDTEIIRERILKKLKQLNLLNDEEFARWWVEQRRNSRNPRGIRAIQSELYRKGVEREIIEQVLKTNEKPATPATTETLKENENTEVALAAKAAQNYLKKLNKPIPPIPPTPPKHWELKRKLGAYLARRGFDWDTIKTTVDKLTTEE